MSDTEVSLLFNSKGTLLFHMYIQNCSACLQNREEAVSTIANRKCQAQSEEEKKTKSAWKNVYKNLKILPENLLMTDHFKRQEQTNQ